MMVWVLNAKGTGEAAGALLALALGIARQYAWALPRRHSCVRDAPPAGALQGHLLQWWRLRPAHSCAVSFPRWQIPMILLKHFWILGIFTPKPQMRTWQLTPDPLLMSGMTHLLTGAGLAACARPVSSTERICALNSGKASSALGPACLCLTSLACTAVQVSLSHAIVASTMLAADCAGRSYVAPDEPCIQLSTSSDSIKGLTAPWKKRLATLRISALEMHQLLSPHGGKHAYCTAGGSAP